MFSLLKVGLCGAGGTGKGTLIREYISSALQGEEITEPVWSPVERIGKLFDPSVKYYKKFAEGSVFNQMQYQYAILAAQIQAEKDASMEIKGTYALSATILCERTVFDYLAYIQDLGVNMKRRYEGMVRRAYYDSPYDVIFFIPYDDFDPEDKEKSSWKERSNKSRKMTNDYLHCLLFNSTEADCSRIEILRGTVEERLKKMQDVIRALR